MGTRVAVEEEPVEVRECRQLIVQNVLVCLVQLEPFPSAQQTPVLEHVEGLWVQCPVRSLAWSVRSAWHLYEAVVEAQVVSQGVLWRLRGGDIRSVAVGEALWVSWGPTCQRWVFLR